MPFPMLPAIVIGSGAALWAWQHNAQASASDLARPPAAPVPTRRPLAALGSAVPVGRKASMMANVGQILVVGGGKGQSPNATPSYQPGGLLSGGGENGSASNDLAAQQHLNALEQKAKEEYGKLEASAKKAAAARLNAEIKPSPGLDGTETFEEACKKVGAAIGAMSAGAACGAIPAVGVLAAPLCATLGAVIGGYLGDKLGPWARDLYDDVKEWSQQTWDRIEDKAVDLAEDVGGAVSDGVESVGNFVGDLF